MNQKEKRRLDAEIMREQQNECDLEEYYPEYCDGCSQKDTCEIYIDRPCE